MSRSGRRIKPNNRWAPDADFDQTPAPAPAAAKATRGGRSNQKAAAAKAAALAATEAARAAEEAAKAEETAVAATPDGQPDDDDGDDEVVDAPEAGLSEKATVSADDMVVSAQEEVTVPPTTPSASNGLDAEAVPDAEDVSAVLDPKAVDEVDPPMESTLAASVDSQEQVADVPPTELVEADVETDAETDAEPNSEKKADQVVADESVVEETVVEEMVVEDVAVEQVIGPAEPRPAGAESDAAPRTTSVASDWVDDEAEAVPATVVDGTPGSSSDAGNGSPAYEAPAALVSPGAVPVKVKSRWRRTSELEQVRHSPNPRRRRRRRRWDSLLYPSSLVKTDRSPLRVP